VKQCVELEIEVNHLLFFVAQYHPFTPQSKIQFGLTVLRRRCGHAVAAAAAGATCDAATAAGHAEEELSEGEVAEAGAGWKQRKRQKA
jgi:hypothetical protein